jgi:biopolymer transport protein ExbB
MTMHYNTSHSYCLNSRWLQVSLYLFLGFCISVTTIPNTVSAMQQNDAFEDDFEDTGDSAPPEAATPATPPPTVPAANGTDVQPLAERSLLTILWEGLGMAFFLVFFIISVTLVALVVMNVLLTRRQEILPTDLSHAFEKHLTERQYQEAYNLVKDDHSFLGKVLTAGMSRLGTGYEQAMEAMQEEGEKQNMALEHRISYLSLIGTVSPMIGLFGTVFGMMKSFGRIRAAVGQTPNASELAGGIETALTTTFVGLFLAIPALIAYNILRNYAARQVMEVGIKSESLMADGFGSLAKRGADEQNSE